MVGSFDMGEVCWAMGMACERWVWLAEGGHSMLGDGRGLQTVGVA